MRRSSKLGSRTASSPSASRRPGQPPPRWRAPARRLLLPRRRQRGRLWRGRWRWELLTRRRGGLGRCENYPISTSRRKANQKYITRLQHRLEKYRAATRSIFYPFWYMGCGLEIALENNDIRGLFSPAA
jgi:hypothetical protein